MPCSETSNNRFDIMLRQMKELITILSLLVLLSKLTVATESLYYVSASDKVVNSTSDSIGNVVVHDKIHCAITCLRTKLCVAAEFDIKRKTCELLGAAEEFEPIEEGQIFTIFQTGSCDFRDSQSETRRK